jgi:ferredoxin-type protein NapG
MKRGIYGFLNGIPACYDANQQTKFPRNTMNRRDFFKRGWHKISEPFRDARLHGLTSDEHWIRPPYARPEHEFLVYCTRCSDCIKACPHHSLLPLPQSAGPQYAGTPVLDLEQHACHLCADWPCVTACKPGALVRPAQDPTPLPRMALAVIDTNTCLAWHGDNCAACRDSCPVDNALAWREHRPMVDTSHCIGCGLCRQACVTEPRSIHLLASA